MKVLFIRFTVFIGFTVCVSFVNSCVLFYRFGFEGWDVGYDCIIS